MKKMMKVAAFAAMMLAAGFVSCQEKIPDYLIVDGTTLTGYTDDVPANLVIPKGITKIAGGAFADCDWLESVTIPGSVKTIGEDITSEEAEEKGMDEENLLVFYNCDSLRNVRIEKGAKIIGIGAFELCKSLASVTIPNSVTKIGERAFELCESLTSVTIPNSVKTIGDAAFWGCKSLTSVTIPSNVTKIGDTAFADCENIAVVTYKGSLKDWCAVDWDSSLIRDAKRIALSDGTDPRKLTEITANDLAGVTKIGANAFSCFKSPLVSVTIPKSVKEIGSQGYDGWKYIAVTYEGSLKDWCALDWDSDLLSNAERIMLSDGTDPRKLTEITANDLAGVTKIGKSAFRNCKSLASVTIPNSVTEIGDDAFAGCESLTSVTIPNSVTAIGESAFYECESLTSVTIPSSVTEIGASAFAGCESLTSVTIPSSVTEIGDRAFAGCESLVSVTIPNSVTEIGEYAFYECESLTSMTIPSSVTKIGYYAFYECTRLTDVTYDGTKAEWGKIAIDDYSDLSGKTITGKNGLTWTAE